ncbi:hypothetical protein C9890_0045 [Perkinsus sp. BL_2016]|nr:hypothetical protein C9890_0045 [Perkinsus sp. BL_2016]
MARAALAHPPDLHILPSDKSSLQVMPAEPRPTHSTICMPPPTLTVSLDEDDLCTNASLQELLNVALSLLGETEFTPV